MRKVISLILASSLLIGACTFTLSYDEGSGNVQKESRSIGTIERVSFEGIGNLVVTQGSETSLEVEAEDNILPRIVTKTSFFLILLKPLFFVSHLQYSNYHLDLQY